ncbi:hypothetical protein, partial [Vibrio cholerae]|uniref:hypothetical protein n=1 Tax=Vibrio cholerae TaxID=666 RepID=UPI0021AF25A1
MVTAVVFEFSGMRCQPLRRALTGNEITHLFWLSFKLLIYIDNKSSKNKRYFEKFDVITIINNRLLLKFHSSLPH